jgi:hypothetical protein
MEEYNYSPGREQEAGDEQSLEPISQALIGLSIRDAYNQQWVREKNERRRDNLAHADGCFVNGTYFIQGVGQKRG